MVNETKKTFPKLLSADLIIPMLLSAAVMSSAAYIYSCGSVAAAMLFSLVSVVMSAFLFLIYELLYRKNKTWMTVGAVACLAVVTLFAANKLISGDRMEEFAQWFMEPSKFTRIYYNRSMTLILLFGFVLISSLYYFTRVRYRGVFVFLVCMCPFALFAKTFTDIPVIFPVIIMTLYFFIMISNSGQKDEGGTTVKRRTDGAFAASVAFVIAVTVIASFFPKAEFAPFRENFDEFVTGVTIRAATANFNDFSDNSSNTTSKDVETPVFYFYGENPVLVKRQCFNIYNISTNTWGYYGNSNEGVNDWWDYTYFEDPADLYDAVGYDGGKTDSKECFIMAASGSIRAVYTPENMTDIGMDDERVKFYRTEMDEYFLGSESRNKYYAYRTTWSRFDIDTKFTELFTDEFADSFSGSYCVDSYIRAKKQAQQYDSFLMSDDTMGSCYTSDARREDVRELAQKVTDGYDTDYDKAKALELFLRNGEYIYDRDFTAADSSPDSFILNVKRGACAAYATAMTLMCRELGMTARYCEGFWVQRYDQNGGYWYVTTGDSHAYVQVWIDGYGWTDFNPTSIITDSGYFDPTFLFVGMFAAAAAVIGLLVILLRPWLTETLFLHRAGRMRGAKQMSLIYGKINRIVNLHEKQSKNLLTPKETAGKCMSLFGIDMNGFVDDYERAVYGGKDDGSSNCIRVYKDFYAAYKAALKRERKRGK